MTKLLAAIVFLPMTAATAQNTAPNGRPRASDLGLKIGILPTGPLDAITDVAGVEVGHVTIIGGDDVRTGVTAILPHPGNLFRDKVPGAVFVGNAFGKLAGSTQVNELGEIETPILLTSTLSVPRVADALIDYMLALPGNQDVESINPLVGETNDGYLNDIRGRHIVREDVFAAIKNAKGGAVEEGSVGAGTGTTAAPGASAGGRCDRRGRRFGDGRHRDRRARGRTEPEADGCEGDARTGTHGCCGLQRQRGLRNRLLDRGRGADAGGGQGVASTDGGAHKRNDIPAVSGRGRGHGGGGVQLPASSDDSHGTGTYGGGTAFGENH